MNQDVLLVSTVIMLEAITQWKNNTDEYMMKDTLGYIYGGRIVMYDIKDRRKDIHHLRM